MAFTHIIEGYRADAIAGEGARAPAHGFAVGLSPFALAAALAFGGLDWTSAWSLAVLSMLVVSFTLYARYFGFSPAKVAARMEALGVIPDPDLGFGRLDAILRKLWVWGWSFGALAGVALVLISLG